MFMKKITFLILVVTLLASQVQASSIVKNSRNVARGHHGLGH